MRVLFAILAVTLGIGSALADDSARGLHIKGATDDEVRPIGSIRSITFNDNNEMTINFRSGKTSTWNIDNVKTIYCPFITVEEQSAIVEVSDKLVTLSNGELHVNGHQGLLLSLFDIYGRRIANCFLPDVWTYDMTSLPKGIYVVRIGNNIYKISHL